MTLVLWGFFMMLAGVVLGYLLDRSNPRQNLKRRRQDLAEAFIDRLEKKK